MTKINIITTPDVIHNKSLSFLLVQPSSNVRDQFQNLLEKFDQPLNIYLYDNWHKDDKRSKFLPLLLNALRTGSRFEIPSPGTLINLCTTESLIRTLSSLIENFEARQWSLCAPKTHTLKEVAAAFIRSENGDECVTFGSVPPFVRQLPFVDRLELENIRI